MNKIALILILGFILLACATIFFTYKSKGRRAFIAVLYIIIFFATIGQSLYYHSVLPGQSPDESAHISYIVHLYDSKEIIPKFEDMHLISGMLKWSEYNSYKYVEELTNYVCHPPLYYQIMRLAGGIQPGAEEAIFLIDKDRLRYFSLGLFAIGLLLLLYIGYSRLDKEKPWLHLFYAVTVTSIPELAYEGCAVTNDTLAIITACITILGLIRFCEKNRNLLTYLLIASGITASLLTKMTTAIMCIFMALLILFISMIKERSIKPSLRKEFYFTIPIYCIALGYFAVLYKNYGTIQPSLQIICSKEYFESTVYYTAPELRESFTFGQYLSFYFKQFFLSWSGCVGNYFDFLKASTTTKTALALEILWAFPAFVFIPAIKKHADKLALPVLSGWVACVLTVLMQIKSAWGTYLTRGYLGGNQSRYYLPFIFAFAMAVVFILSTLYERFKNNKIASLAISVAAIGYAFIIFYSSFPFFLLHHASTIEDLLKTIP